MPLQLRLRVLQPVLYPDLYIVPHLAEPLQHGVVGEALVGAGIVKDPGEPRPHAWEILGAPLLGAGAHYDEVVEELPAEVYAEALRALARDVYPDLRHRLVRAGMDLVGRLQDCAHDLEAVAREVAQEPFGHLWLLAEFWVQRNSNFCSLTEILPWSLTAQTR